MGKRAVISALDSVEGIDRIAMAGRQRLKSKVTRLESRRDAKLANKHPSHGPRGGKRRALSGMVVGIGLSRCLISL